VSLTISLVLGDNFGGGLIFGFQWNLISFISNSISSGSIFILARRDIDLCKGTKGGFVVECNL